VADGRGRFTILLITLMASFGLVLALGQVWGPSGVQPSNAEPGNGEVTWHPQVREPQEAPTEAASVLVEVRPKSAADGEQSSLELCLHPQAGWEPADPGESPSEAPGDQSNPSDEDSARSGQESSSVTESESSRPDSESLDGEPGPAGEESQSPDTTSNTPEAESESSATNPESSDDEAGSAGEEAQSVDTGSGAPGPESQSSDGASQPRGSIQCQEIPDGGLIIEGRRS